MDYLKYYNDLKEVFLFIKCTKNLENSRSLSGMREELFLH